MSKDIVIQEGGQGKNLTADKLRTALVGGGDCLWVPEDEVQLTTKTITEDGTYIASDEGYYGYSEVTVNGIGTATGTGPDGERHSYSEDGAGGIVDNLLPASISVVTPPTITTYPDGATIDFTGMVVKGYLRSGDLWTDSSHPDGVIPISELTLPVTTADIGSASGGSASSPLIPGGVPCDSTGLTIYGPLDSTADTYYYIVGEAVVWAKEREDRNTVQYFFAAASPDAVGGRKFYFPDGTSESDTVQLSRSYTYDERTVYYNFGGSGFLYPIKSMNPDGTNVFKQYEKQEIAWTIIYGDKTPGGQVIPVQYISGWDTLESSFNIRVTPSINYGDDDPAGALIPPTIDDIIGNITGG